MKNIIYNTLIGICGLLITVSANGQSIKTNSIFPGAKVYDVTKPESWGGKSNQKSTPNDPANDDAEGINAAIRAAVQRIIEVTQLGYGVNQQIIYIPEGEYHLASSVIIPTIPEVNKKEFAIWIHGQSNKNTVLNLKKAQEIGLFGTSERPKPLLQYAVYTHGNEASGNTNFLLWATDFSINVPNDQPNAIGISYGSANIGGIRNLKLKAEGEGGHTGLALVQYNNGPGWVEHLIVEGFDTGIEINDGHGETFAFSDITLINQNGGGKGITITDKMIAIENLVSIQDKQDVVPVYLFDDDSYNSNYGGAPHITLINSNFISTVPSNLPAICVEKGHSFLRNISSSAYGNYIINDHNKRKHFTNGNIREYISVHGYTETEKKNVIYTLGNSPSKSMNLQIKQTPEIELNVWEELKEGNYTIVCENDLVSDRIESKTPWLILDPSKSKDDTRLLQASLNSGAKYIGLMNNEPFHISNNILINDGGGTVELLFGYTSEIYIDSLLSNRQKHEIPNNQTLFTIYSGNTDQLIIKGLRFTTPNRNKSDLLYFQNNSSKTVVFEDLSGKAAPKAYRNGSESYGTDIFFENVMFAFSGIYMEEIVVTKNQNVWARQFNLEAPVGSPSVNLFGMNHSKMMTDSRLLNDNGNIWVFSQKFGEHNGVFVETRNSGKTELLSCYFNLSRSTHLLPRSSKATNFVVKGKGSDFSLVGQERIRTRFTDNQEASETLPHGNTFGRVELNGEDIVIHGTKLPTYLTYPDFDPFNDNELYYYNKKNHFRISGLIRIKLED